METITEMEYMLGESSVVKCGVIAGSSHSRIPVSTESSTAASTSLCGKHSENRGTVSTDEAVAAAPKEEIFVVDSHRFSGKSSTCMFILGRTVLIL